MLKMRVLQSVKNGLTNGAVLGDIPAQCVHFTVKQQQSVTVRKVFVIY